MGLKGKKAVKKIVALTKKKKYKNMINLIKCNIRNFFFKYEIIFKRTKENMVVLIFFSKMRTDTYIKDFSL